MKAYIIVGDANTGKSSVIRGLTGVRASNGNNQRLIKLKDYLNPIRISVHVCSLQELNPIKTAENFSTEIQKMAGIDGAVLALRIGVPPFDALSYLNHFLTLGWDMRVFVLGETKIIWPTHNNQAGSLDIIKNAPFNVTVKKIKKHFGWE